MTGKADEWIKIVLAILALVVVVATWVVRRFLVRRKPRSVETIARVQRASTLLLWCLAAFGVGNYFGFDVENLTGIDRIDGYDTVHYYLNAKYFDELGYTHLYEAIVIADLERKDNFRRWGFQAIRDLDDNSRVPMASVRARADEIKARFTKARWREFKHDFRFLQRTISRRLQIELVNDHGYNATPFLQTVAGTVTRHLPVERLKLVCHVETLLLLLMLVVVYRTYGSRVAALVVLWYSVDFSARWPGVSFGLFRLDWFVALVVACCLMSGADGEPREGRSARWHRARPVLAGVLIAYSAMQRIFPVVWLFGMGARAIWFLIARRRVEPVFARMLAGFVAAAAIFGGLAYWNVGERNVREFVEDMEEHLRPENLSQQRMGFAVALAYRGEYGGFRQPGDRERKWELVGSLRRYRFAGAILALFLLGLTIRPKDDPEAGARTDTDDATLLGFVPFYFLMIASHYYWIARTTMLLHHGKHEDGGGEHIVGLCVLFAIEVLSNYIDEATHFRYALSATASVALGLYCAFVVGVRLWRTYRRSAAAGGADG
ncbi:MAG: hypothetical protein HYY06_30630 [Deltaproteobacteria bacterium]|nr:hypothetical protein [Deltaproteobacteria bacterium]